MHTKRSEESIDLLPIDAARLLRLQIDRTREGAGLGLTAGEARTLAYLSLYPASRQTALAAQMSISPWRSSPFSTGWTAGALWCGSRIRRIDVPKTFRLPLTHNLHAFRGT